MKPSTQIAPPPRSVNGSLLVQSTNAPPWSEVAAASSMADSTMPTPSVLPICESTPKNVPNGGEVEPAPVQSVVENWVSVNVNVTPSGAANTFTLPSVNATVARGFWDRSPLQGDE